MMKRARQFERAIRANISGLAPEDYTYVRENLPQAAAKLFWGMNIADQYHALQVAYTVERLAKEELAQGQSVDLALLRRTALLHDVGKVKGDMGTLGKVLAVLMYGAAPRLAKKLAKRGERVARQYDKISRVLYVHRYHPAIGAAKLRAVGLTKEAEMIKHHHEPLSSRDSLELRLLKQADEQN
ncbi:MAG: HD domain-containing protein [Selenomonadaceae bacterium]|nr:HD domain-containing protein [Selenomonadaceae bacterium]